MTPKSNNVQAATEPIGKWRLDEKLVKMRPRIKYMQAATAPNGK
eukprot:CAMPEP_0183420792 /NCGR_PEP_ID=MMETSP0370-20130417/26678_1 /TAXON_ID=268820 /ORGANISM="Peridinium aciculiferum, Strain PAER-2" /LENGTH=43 /DNA_ID= /DNA_START= /DNA_END= /DNA_ORIENTATION=